MKSDAAAQWLAGHDPQNKQKKHRNRARPRKSAQRYFDERLQAWVTVCPPGAALGASDLKHWGQRRALGLSGSDDWNERERAEKWAKGEPITGRKRWRPSKRKRAALKIKSAE